jgi:hypothetical protein
VTRVVPVWAVLLSLVAGLLVVPGMTGAQPMQQGQQPSPPSRPGPAAGRVGTGGHAPMHPAVHPPFVHRPLHLGHRPFLWTTPAWYGSVPYYGPTPDYVPPVVIALAPPPPPVPSVIEYPTGRFEIRGDGITSPYHWVWIPNPPAAPPTPPPPPAPRAPVAAEPSSSRPSQLYRWVDDDGVANWTDAWDSVPERYRAQAKRRMAG